MENTEGKYLLLTEDAEWLKLNGWYINCITAENAEYLLGLENTLHKVAAENLLLRRRLNDMIAMTSLHGNH